MSITAGGFQGSFGWAQSQTNTGFGDTSQGSDGISASISPDLTTYNAVMVGQYTMAGSGTQTIDLRNYVDLLNVTHTTTSKVIGMIVTVAGANVKLEPGTTNPLTWFWTGTIPVLIIKSGGFLVFGDGDYTTVDATHSTLKLTNLSSSLSATVRIGFLCGQ